MANEKITDAYLHCALCDKEDRKQHIDVSTNGKFIQVWCLIHNADVCTLELAEPLSTKCQGEDHGK